MEKAEGRRDWIIAVLLSSIIGFLGADRFYLGYIGTGIAKLLTFGGFGIWAIVDSILIIGNKIPDSRGVLPYKKEPPKELVESGQVSKKEWIVALMYAIFFGWMGADRFYLGHKKLGILKACVSLLCFLFPLGFVVYSGTLLNNYDPTYHALFKSIFITMLFAILFASMALIWWMVDLVIIALNKITDGEGKRLWK